MRELLRGYSVQFSKSKQIATLDLRATVVNLDESSFTIQYHEYRARIKPPFDVITLTDAERNANLEKRKLKSKIEEEVDNKNKPHDHCEKKTPENTYVALMHQLIATYLEERTRGHCLESYLSTHLPSSMNY
jgi:hypothetical protein